MPDPRTALSSFPYWALVRRPQDAAPPSYFLCFNTPDTKLVAHRRPGIKNRCRRADTCFKEQIVQIALRTVRSPKWACVASLARRHTHNVNIHTGNRTGTVQPGRGRAGGR
jgi:hypothetical protein